MASEVSGTSGTPVLRAFKEGEGAPWESARVGTRGDPLVPDLPPAALLIIALPVSRRWALPGAPAGTRERPLSLSHHSSGGQCGKPTKAHCWEGGPDQTSCCSNCPRVAEST